MRKRRAVGAVVVKDDRYLMVHKVKIMNAIGGPIDTPGRWDFPKGGVEEDDNDLRQAVIRELLEETGKEDYIIIKEFADKISFEFTDDMKQKMGFDIQETTMFLVEYTGKNDDFKAQDDEIDDIKFFTKNEVIKNLSHKEQLDFFTKNTPQ